MKDSIAKYRYVLDILENKDSFQYFIGKSNDFSGCAVSFFIKESGDARQVVFIDDDIACARTKKINLDMINSLNFEKKFDYDRDELSEINSVIYRLCQEFYDDEVAL